MKGDFILQARKGQTVKAEVVFFTDDFVLVAFKQHAVGMFAYLPTKQVNGYYLAAGMLIDSVIVRLIKFI